jgi:hypothetical protein
MMSQGKMEGNRSDSTVISASRFVEMVGKLPRLHGKPYIDARGNQGIAYWNSNDMWSVVLPHGTYWISDARHLPENLEDVRHYHPGPHYRQDDPRWRPI